MQFADVKNDVAFRKIFGNETRKEALISFLNAVLNFGAGEKIVSATILNPYQLPKLRGGKVTIIDVKATDEKNRNYIVEMQVAEQDGCHKRVLYYTAKSYSDQIQRGDLYRNLEPVFFIGILDFTCTQNPNFISRNRVLDLETGENTVRDVEFTFIELPKFVKTASELESLTDKWVFFIKNAENLDVIPSGVEDPGLKSAYEEANQHTWTKAELDAYDYAFMREEDERARFDAAMRKGKEMAMQQGMEKGMEKGKEEGMALGERTKQIEIARNLRRLGLSDEAIATATGLSPDEMNNL